MNPSPQIKYVSHPWINPNTIEDRDYQENIFKIALKGNTLCVLPTGLGKTALAALVTAERLKESFDNAKKKKEEAVSHNDIFISADNYSNNFNAKVIFLAPTRPLVNQHRSSFEKFLKIGPDELKVITGTIDPGKRRELYRQADIIFATPQTIRNDIKNGILNLTDFSLLIIDEAHRAVGNYAYVFIAKKYMEQSRNPLILALTASPGSSKQKIEMIKKALNIEYVTIRSREDEDVSPYVQKLEKSWVEINLPEEFRLSAKLLEKCKESRIKKLLEWKIIFNPYITKREIIRLQAELVKRRTGTSFAAMSVLAEIMKIDHALILLETQTLHSFQRYVARLKQQKSKAITRLFRDKEWLDAIARVEKMYESNVENPKLSKLSEIVKSNLNTMSRFIIFTQYRDTADKILEKLKEIPNARPALFIGQAKKTRKDHANKMNKVSGATLTSTSSSAARGLSQAEQMEILDRFKLGGYNILIATSIGEEGLDITETDTVIFFEPIPSEIRTIQRAGRTARTKPGKVLILMNKGTRDQAFYWSAHHKEKKMYSILSSMQKKSLWSYGK